MKKITATATSVLFAITLAACGAPSASDPNALPQAPSSSAADKTTAPADTPAPAEQADKPTTCDVAREAILTGTPKQIKKAFEALVKDKTADATAREYARYYLGRDKNDKDLREMDIGLIQMSCSL